MSDAKSLDLNALPPAAVPARRGGIGGFAKRLLIVTVVAGLLAAAAHYALPLLNRPAPPPRTLEVHKRPIAAALHEIGSISAHIERTVLARFTGEITWRAEDGTPVEVGDPVAIFDARILKEDVERREKDLSDKKDAVERAKAAIDVLRKRYEYAIGQKEIDLHRAEIDRNAIMEYPRADDLLDVQLTWRSAVKSVELAQEQTDGVQELGRKGFSSDAEVKKKLLELANAKAEAARAKLILDLTKQGRTADSKRVAELALSDARKALNVSKFNRDADLAAAQTSLDLAEIDLDDYERDLKRKLARLDAATVRAPIKGRVVFQPVRKSYDKSADRNFSPVQVGETRQDGTDICKVLDTSKLVVSLWINEMDIGNVREGQKARITLPALPGKSFDAEVSEISISAQDKNNALSWLALRRSGEAFVNVVKVKLEFKALDNELKERIRVGFTADVHLFTDNGAPELSVPWQAVGRLADGTAFADVAANGKIERRILKLGRSDSANVHVREGLAEGMQVLDRSNAMIAANASTDKPDDASEPQAAQPSSAVPPPGFAEPVR